ncbi:MAG: hypothetical protein JWO38_3293 [Gemmataceae bacterium]|nr:hypothetical protein [Gemmataceae bacterium]
MEIPVIVEPADGGYRTRSRPRRPAALRGRVAEPFALLPLEATPDKPWISSAGSVPDDEVTEMWLDATAEYRREQDTRDQATLPPAPNAQPMP